MLNKIKYSIINTSKLALILSGIFLSLNAKSQIANYVNNPSFETALPSATMNPFDAAKFWAAFDSLNNISYYLFGKPPLGAVPYCSTGFQYPRTGKNFALSQFFCDNCPREYPRNRLKQVLKPNTVYCAKYYVVNTNNNRVAIDSYAAYFGNSTLDTITHSMVPLTYLNPQIQNTAGIITDTLNWIPITGTFVAIGDEKYMVLGNFKSNAATNTLLINTPTLTTMSNDVYIDDVSLIEFDLPAFAGRDTIVFPGNSVFLGREPDIGIDEACIWYKLPDMVNPIDTVAGFWINPTATATYVVKQQLWCNNTPKWDTVVVETSIYVGLNKVRLSVVEGALELYPNPAQDFLELKTSNPNLLKEFNSISIYNTLGALIRKEEVVFENKTFILKTNDLENGVYFLTLKSNNLGTVSKRFVISR
ncbi:T9SS type A sorting domain-containing protein [Aurantibacillus circumpalustris]|uniref:T9SS type A sorting domain-containing protein n=1 Tax=Aurantibacillus circumpalustris TaxID=3036359 RepID=UPI00295AAF2A|nr:T9SS type A sorting domain-containing protein [Aurantibacillus circumpalustris]